MKCPVCKDVDLVMSERQGVEIDYCPTCRGVWLDRGELDKIIERSSVAESPKNSGLFGLGGSREHHDDHDDRDRRHGGYEQGHRRKSWLGELFD